MKKLIALPLILLAGCAFFESPAVWRTDNIIAACPGRFKADMETLTSPEMEKTIEAAKQSAPK